MSEANRQFSSGLDKLRSMTGRPEMDKALNGHGQEPLDGGDCTETLQRDGRECRHQVFSVQLVKENRDAQAVIYSSIHSPIRFDPSRGISFQFEGAGQQLYDVRIEGGNLERVFDKLAEGKRVSIRENGSSVMRISVTAAAEE